MRTVHGTCHRWARRPGREGLMGLVPGSSSPRCACGARAPCRPQLLSQNATAFRLTPLVGRGSLPRMFCSRCGSEITGKSKFCPSCGLDLMATTPVHAIATGAFQETDLVREALAAEYEIIEELGRGGMAMVYRARDRQLEREVAIKVLPFSLAFDAEFVERFQREARTAAQLEHPNIIPIYRVGRSGPGHLLRHEVPARRLALDRPGRAQEAHARPRSAGC